MRIDVITLFPEFLEPLRTHSMIGRAISEGRVQLELHNLRDWATDNYGTVDDRPYGGGVGMVLRVDVMHAAIAAITKAIGKKAKIILLTPQGQTYKQATAQGLSKEENLILICGHYEGFDERIRDYVDLEISVGDYVLTGGELPAMIIIDSVARLLPGVLGHDESSVDESFGESLDGGLEYPQYTRPPTYDGKKVPEILMSGDHPKISKWRKEQAQSKTKSLRPDLVK